MSVQAAETLGLDDRTWAEWRKCWAGIGSNRRLPIVEREMQLHRQLTTRFRLNEAVALNPTIQIDSGLYHGDVAPVRICWFTTNSD